MIKFMRKASSVFFLAISCLLCVPAVRAQMNSNLRFVPPLLSTPIYMDAAGRIYAPNTTLFDLQGRKLTNFVWAGTAGSSSSSNLTLLGTNGSMIVSLGTDGNVQFTLTTSNGVYKFDRPISVPGLTGGVTNQFVGTNQFQVYTLATSNAFRAYTNWAYTNFPAVFTTFTTLWQPSANGSVCPSGGTWTDSSWVGNTNQIYPQ